MRYTTSFSPSSGQKLWNLLHSEMNGKEAKEKDENAEEFIQPTFSEEKGCFLKEGHFRPFGIFHFIFHCFQKFHFEMFFFLNFCFNTNENETFSQKWN